MSGRLPPLLLAGAALLAAWLAAPAALAQSTGKVAGTVTDVSGAPLPGANVVVEGTTRGTVTNGDGSYNLLLRPGTYTLLYRFVGFDDVRAEDVQVQIDKTTRLDVEMREATVEGEEVVVTAERPIVEMDRTTTKAVVDAEQLEALPIVNVSDVVNLQAGVVDGHFRGGRLQEVAYLVNGVPINNAFDGRAAFQVEQNMIENLEVISGVFNAEYGQALSGVVNVVTKDVPRDWSASYLGFVGGVASSQTLEFVERTAPAGGGLRIDDFTSVEVPYYEAAGFPNQLDQQVSFGGPLFADRLGVRLTARYFRQDGTDIARRLFTPADSSTYRNDDGDVFFGINGGEPDSWRIQSTGDQAFVPLNGGQRVSLNGNVVANVTDRLKLDYNVFWQDGESRFYSHAFKYNPDGLSTGYSTAQTHIGAARYLLGDNTFANLSYSYLRDEAESYLYEDPTDPRYVPSSLSSQTGPYAFSFGGNSLNRSERLTQTHTVVGSVESQLTPVHLVKAGFQTRFHRLDNRDYATFVDAGGEVRINPSRFSDDRLNVRPWEAAVYVQDKIELRNLIINAGLRFDYFDASYPIPNDWSQADEVYVLDPDNPESESVLCNEEPTSPNFPGQDYLENNCLFNRQDVQPEYQVSPRLGIAFPISATGVLRASAGLFFQTPRFNLLYTNPEYETGLFGNPSLDAERTLSFEMGLQQGLTSTLGVELTAYSKDIRNLTGTEVLLDPRGEFVSRWINVDIGTVRGFTISLTQRPTGVLGWTLDYTLQFAEGTASDPGESFIRGASGEREEVRLVRLNWDRRHSLNNTLTLRPLDGLRVSFINRFQTGRPYTSVRGPEAIESIVKNDQDQPGFFLSDMRVFYTLPFLRQAEAFLQVDNLTDAQATVQVYRDTGLATESAEAERQRGVLIRGLNSLDEYIYQPAYFAAPRRVNIGLRVAL